LFVGQITGVVTVTAVALMYVTRYVTSLLAGRERSLSGNPHAAGSG
jgi:hypothetical protein